MGFTVAHDQTCGKDGRKSGVEVVLSCVEDGEDREARPTLALCSPSGRSLVNDFNEQELRSQGLVLAPGTSSIPGHLRGRSGAGRGGAAWRSPVFVCKAAFEAPADMRQLEQRVHERVSARGGALHLTAPEEVVRLAFVGPGSVSTLEGTSGDARESRAYGVEAEGGGALFH